MKVHHVAHRYGLGRPRKVRCAKTTCVLDGNLLCQADFCRDDHESKLLCSQRHTLNIAMHKYRPCINADGKKFHVLILIFSNI
jgi:hypothetical protein